jgi:putative addiction module component (TIGR02574 family)
MTDHLSENEEKSRINTAQIEELERRLAQVKSGKIKLITWPELKNKLDELNKWNR